MSGNSDTPSKFEVSGKKNCKVSKESINIYYCLIASKAYDVLAMKSPLLYSKKIGT